MYRNIFSRFFLPAAIFLVAGACAKISSPSGGPRDRQAPVVVQCIPENGTRNFSGTSFSITFDEYVVLDNINEKFMVSPPMKKKPRVFIKKRSVNVEFEDELADSTTYTFYFQDAIRDLNEGNIINNYSYVFSTGPVIDSLSVTGNVYNAFNLEAPENTLVLMYRNLNDSAVVKLLPDYISRVGPGGYFRLDNIRPGRYNLFALKDIDNSKNYNLHDEEFAFMNSPIDVTVSNNYLPVVKDTSAIKKDIGRTAEPSVLKGEYRLFLFQAERKEHYLTGSSRDLKYRLMYTLSRPPDSMKLEFSVPGSDGKGYFTETSRYRDTLNVWLTDTTLYLQQQLETVLSYPFTDTLGLLGYKTDTIPMRFLEPRVPRSVKVKKPPYKVESNVFSRALKPGQKIVINSQTPLRQPDTTRIRIYELDEKSRTSIPFSVVRDSLTTCRYFLLSELLPGKDYLFIADSASFGNIYNENTDSTGVRFSVREADSYNKLILNIQNNEGNLIVQLLTSAEKLLSQKKFPGNGLVEFPLLDNGVYRVRAVYDLNGDGKWTTGDYDLRRQPEPVSYYQPGEIELKTGWELTQDWSVQERNFKEDKLRANRGVKK